MNETEAAARLSALTETVPDSPAPLAELLSAGAARRRRNGQARLAGALAVLAVVALGAVVLPGGTAGDTAVDPSTPSSSATEPGAPQLDPADLQPVFLAEDLTGYSWRQDLDGVAPRNPQEALAWQDRMGTRRVLAYRADGVTVIGVFGGGGPQATTALVAPAGALPTRVDGVLEIDDRGCTYLVDGTRRTWVIWSWGVQLRRPVEAVPMLEDFTEQQRTVATSGDRLTLDGLRLDGQRVASGPCPTDEPPLYVGTGEDPLPPEPTQPTAGG